MYRQRTPKAWGHTAHHGWARLLLDRARDLNIHGPARRGANGAAMPTDEDEQGSYFLFNHPEREGGLLRQTGLDYLSSSRALGRAIYMYCTLPLPI